MSNGAEPALATSKDHAFRFLVELENTLNKSLPVPSDMEAWVKSTVQEARLDDKQKHLRLPEAAFLNGKVVPVVFNLIRAHADLSVESAQIALRNESHDRVPSMSCHSPIRWERHPFKKVLGTPPDEIYLGWKEPDRGGALTQSCPDFALGDPFPYTIVFEGKYFRAGSPQFAQRVLVTNIYQAFFYRGLPRLAASKKRPEWSYDYACFLAYDASPKGTLVSAWQALPEKTRSSFWGGANVYVMILRGGEAYESNTESISPFLRIADTPSGD